MIFTSCAKCGHGIVSYYESGQEPYGNAYDMVECDKCGAENYVQRVSINGETLSSEEAEKRGMKIMEY